VQLGVSVRPGQALGVADAVRVSIPSASGLALLERALSRIGVPAGRPVEPASLPAAARPSVAADYGRLIGRERSHHGDCRSVSSGLHLARIEWKWFAVQLSRQTGELLTA
jgi:hypothetical protein